MYDMKWKNSITLNKEAIQTVRTRELDHYTLIVGTKSEIRSNNVLNNRKS
jgi:hypothetical protein